MLQFQYCELWHSWAPLNLDGDKSRVFYCQCNSNSKTVSKKSNNLHVEQWANSQSWLSPKYPQTLDLGCAGITVFLQQDACCFQSDNVVTWLIRFRLNYSHRYTTWYPTSFTFLFISNVFFFHDLISFKRCLFFMVCQYCPKQSAKLTQHKKKHENEHNAQYGYILLTSLAVFLLAPTGAPYAIVCQYRSSRQGR